MHIYVKSGSSRLPVHSATKHKFHFNFVFTTRCRLIYSQIMWSWVDLCGQRYLLPTKIPFLLAANGRGVLKHCLVCVCIILCPSIQKVYYWRHKEAVKYSVSEPKDSHLRSPIASLPHPPTHPFRHCGQ